jgi:Ca-activated chloride channel family protein
MKTTLGILACAFLLAANVAYGAANQGMTEREIRLDGRLNYPFLSTSGGKVFLQMTVVTSNFPSIERRPMNIAVVLDRSGSMSDQRKMEYAKKALSSLVDQLSSNDILSIVIYDDVIEVLRPAKRVGNDQQRIKRAIERVSPRNMTNLGGGMIEGFRQVERNLSKEYVNRVVLLSDGLANQGITDPAELNRIAQRYRSKSVSLTTMGVGLDYNENLMMGLAEHGGGNYYFIEHPTMLASIIRKELKSVSSIIAQNAFIELTLGRGVRLHDVIGCEHSSSGERYMIPVGDLYSNDTREFTAELEMPEGTGKAVVAEGKLRFESDEKGVRVQPTFASVAHYTKDVVVIEKHRDWDTQAKADVAVSTRQVERAMKALDEGRMGEAAQELSIAKDALQNSPASAQAGANGAMIQDQLQKLESYEEMVRDSSGDANRAKKSIQYDNYRTQKKKE